jgi:hypothetical protein
MTYLNWTIIEEFLKGAVYKDYGLGGTYQGQ